MPHIESQFSKQCQKLLNSPTESASGPHVLGSLETGEEALFVRIHLVRSARKTIDLQTFIWANDESGRYMAYELLQAARRGVKVRLLIDGWVCLGDPSLMACIGELHPNMEVRFYNPANEKIGPSTFDLISAALSDFEGSNHRMHSKTFIVDNKCVIVGGRNYQNDYFDRSTHRNFRDREILLFGPSTAGACRSFEAFWSHERSVLPQRLNDYDSLISAPHSRFNTRESFNLGNLFDEVDQKASDPRFMDGYFCEQLQLAEEVRYVGDPPGVKNDELNPTLQALLSFLSESTRSLLLQSPYFVLDETHFNTFKELRKRIPGMQIRISTNSLAATDNPIAYAHSYRERVRDLIELLLEIYELKPLPGDRDSMMGFHRSASSDTPEFSRNLDDESTPECERPPLCCHAKTFIRDDTAVWIGSSNVDPRSAWLNTENGYVVFDEAFANRVQATILRDIEPQNSWVAGLATDAPALAALRDLLRSVVPGDGLSLTQMFRYPENFQLNSQGREVRFFDKEFYRNYSSVGPFPLVSGSSREIGVRLISMLPEQTKALV